MQTHRIVYLLQGAMMAGEKRHAQTVMRELSEEHGFRILRSEPEPIYDAWVFWIEADGPVSLPEFARIMDEA